MNKHLETLIMAAECVVLTVVVVIMEVTEALGRLSLKTKARSSVAQILLP